MMEYRWLTDDEIEQEFNPACRAQGYAEMNINPERPTCRVLGAFWDGQLVEAFAFQMYPVLGPMLKVDSTFRDNGETSRTLAIKMEQFFDEAQARACLTIADTPLTERLCERFGMERVTRPVYSFVRRT